MINLSENNSTNRQAAVNGLAVVGFVALVGAGMWLAVYSTRFIPTVVNGVGEAAVYLGSIFTPAPGLSVVPTSTASTTIFFGTANSTVSTSTKAIATSTPTKKIVTIAGTETNDTYQISGTTTPTLSGLPDFEVNINAIGYLATSSASSFIASSTVPSGFRPAVHFTIKNIGTNVSGLWNFNASIPTSSNSIQTFSQQQNLKPGESIEYWLSFDYISANKGAGEVISITANFDHAIGESNMNNNTASSTVTILGS